MAKQDPFTKHEDKRAEHDDDKTPAIVTIPKAPPAPPSSAAASALGGSPEKRSVESWAEGKGMLPMEVRAYGVSGAAAINPEYWKFAAARALRRWQDGEQVSEADFDAAVTEALTGPIR